MTSIHCGDGSQLRADVCGSPWTVLASSPTVTGSGGRASALCSRIDCFLHELLFRVTLLWGPLGLKIMNITNERQSFFMQICPYAGASENTQAQLQRYISSFFSKERRSLTMRQTRNECAQSHQDLLVTWPRVHVPRSRTWRQHVLSIIILPPWRVLFAVTIAVYSRAVKKFTKRLFAFLQEVLSTATVEGAPISEGNLSTLAISGLDLFFYSRISVHPSCPTSADQYAEFFPFSAVSVR